MRRTMLGILTASTLALTGCAGASMLAAHRGMNISDAEFAALVEDLVKSLDKFKVPAQEKHDLLAALAGMKGDIVGR